MNDATSPNSGRSSPLRDARGCALKVGGVTPFSATDYPGKLSAVVFVQGCPWRCGYCHNPHLQSREAANLVGWPRLLAFLQRRVGLVDAVVFSGGEPTLDPSLIVAMAEVRAMGFAIGLHTACIYPHRLEHVLPLADWVGFDIKANFEAYARVTGVEGSGGPARACVQLIVDSGVEHECRTTIHPSLQTPDELVRLAETLSGMGVRHYALQQFRPQGCLDKTLVRAPAHYPGADALATIAELFERFTLRQEA